MPSEPSTTLKVSPPPPVEGGFLGALVLLVALIVLIVVFTAVSSLVGTISVFSKGPWWRLGAGLGVTFFLPLIFAFWLRRRGGARRRSPRGVTMILLIDLLLGGALGAGMPGRTRQALERDGHWWVEAIVRAAGVKGSSAVVDAGKVGVRTLARLLPGEEEKRSGERAPASQPVPTPTSQATKPRETARQTDDGASARSDGGRDHGTSDVGMSKVSPHDAPVAPQSAEPDEILVRFETGHAGIVVPVVFKGPAGKVKVKMLFDTGASLTTINARTLSSLGLRVPSFSPTIMTSTANGKTRSTLVVIPAITLGGSSTGAGGAHVGGGLAVALCEPCASGGTSGLLGLNFSRHFTVMVDHDGGKLTLRRKLPDPGNTRDLRHFVEIKKIRGMRRGDHFTVTAVVFNRSPYPIEALRFAVKFSGGKKSLSSDLLGRLGAGAPSPIRIEKSFQGPIGSFALRVSEGRWELPRTP